jgi:hypothetical protein
MDALAEFQQMMSAEEFTQVQFSIDGETLQLTEKRNGAPVYFEVGRNMLVLRSYAGECIIVEMGETINLNEYYWKASKHSCPLLQHVVFFKILDVLSSLFKRDLTVTDESRKTLVRPGIDDPTNWDCDIPYTIMALAKGRTFYNQFGFVNQKFSDLIAEGQDMPLYNYQPYLTDDKYSIISDNSSSITMKEVALRILELCEKKQIDDVVYEFIKLFHDKHLKEDINVGNFRKPFDKNNYDVALTKKEGFVQVAFTKAFPSGGRKRSRRRRSRRHTKRK